MAKEWLTFIRKNLKFIMYFELYNTTSIYDINMSVMVDFKSQSLDMILKCFICSTKNSEPVWTQNLRSRKKYSQICTGDSSNLTPRHPVHTHLLLAIGKSSVSHETPHITYRWQHSIPTKHFKMCIAFIHFSSSSVP